MRWLLVAVALLAGAGLAVQVGFNNGLRARTSHPVWAALISFAVGTAALGLYLVTLRPSPPATTELARGPWWIWMGGLVGAVYVVSAAAFGNKLGAAPWLALVVTGQILTALVLDHFGLIGFAPRRVDGLRLIGVVLLLAGVVLILRR